MSWENDIEAAMNILGGQAHLTQLYPVVGMVRLTRGKTPTRHFQSAVRCILQTSGCFRSVDGNGTWTIKKRRRR